MELRSAPETALAKEENPRTKFGEIPNPKRRKINPGTRQMWRCSAELRCASSMQSMTLFPKYASRAKLCRCDECECVSTLSLSPILRNSISDSIVGRCRKGDVLVDRRVTSRSPATTVYTTSTALLGPPGAWCGPRTQTIWGLGLWVGRALVDLRAGTLGRGLCPELPALMNPNLKVSVGKAPLVQSEATELLHFAFLFLLNAFSGVNQS